MALDVFVRSTRSEYTVDSRCPLCNRCGTNYMYCPRKFPRTQEGRRWMVKELFRLRRKHALILIRIIADSRDFVDASRLRRALPIEVIVSTALDWKQKQV